MGKPDATFRDRSLKPSGFQVSLGPNALVPDAVCLLVCCAYLVRMSEPYVSDIVDRIICYIFCFSFSVNNIPMLRYVKMLLLTLLICKMGRVITLPLQCGRKKSEGQV